MDTIDFPNVIREIQEAHRKLDLINGAEEDETAYWMGSGCGEHEILAFEARLGEKLPQSYRTFVREVNGCGRLVRSFGGLWQAEKVDWVRTASPWWVDIWSRITVDDITEAEHLIYGEGQSCVSFRHAYVPHLLQIGDHFDSSVYLLNPKVVDLHAEWEAWKFCASYPGAVRYPSFACMVESARRAIARELKIAAAEFDEEKIIFQALPELRRLRSEEGLAATEAIVSYLESKQADDDAFVAWFRREDGYHKLLRALRT